MSTSYAKPPIVEAVFEVRPTTELGLRELERLRDRFKKNYQLVEDQREIEVQINPGGVGTSSKLSGFKLTAKNGNDVIVLNRQALATARLAPYVKWENLLESAKQNLSLFTRIVGNQELNRLAVRYINRIDIPADQICNTKEYLTFGIAIPATLAENIGPYSLAVQFKEQDSGANILLQSGVVESPLIQHFSIVIDIDVSFTADIPKKIDDIWPLAEKLRTAKNHVFERLITDKTRGLFK